MAYDFGAKNRNSLDDDLYSGFDTGFSHDPNSQAGHLGRAGLGPVGATKLGALGHANAGTLGQLHGLNKGSKPSFNPGNALAGRGGITGRNVQGTARMMTAQGTVGNQRPMTSIKGAGFQSGASKTSHPAFDPLNQNRGPAPPLVNKADDSPEERAKQMERKVHRLINQSALSRAKNDMSAALDLAKDAAKKERALCKFREGKGLTEQINLDLTYSVGFNLACLQHKSKMYSEALQTYGVIVKNKQYPQAGRLRVNMGNIYYEQKKYMNAIKHYRMALDQIPNTSKELRYKIMRNIGHAFVRLGQFHDAIDQYETVVNEGHCEASGYPDYTTAFNVLVRVCVCVGLLVEWEWVVVFFVGGQHGVVLVHLCVGCQGTVTLFCRQGISLFLVASTEWYLCICVCWLSGNCYSFFLSGNGDLFFFVATELLNFLFFLLECTHGA